MLTKHDRQSRLLTLIDSHEIATQEDLVSPWSPRASP